MSVSCDGGDEPRSSEDRITKKVRFKEENGEQVVDMIVDLEPTSTLTWKDKLLGEGSGGSSMREESLRLEQMKSLCYSKVTWLNPLLTGA